MEMEAERAHQLEQEGQAWMEAWLAQQAEPLVELGVSWQQEDRAYAPEPRGADSGHRYRHRPRDQMGSSLPFLSRSKLRKTLPLRTLHSNHETVLSVVYSAP